MEQKLEAVASGTPSFRSIDDGCRHCLDEAEPSLPNVDVRAAPEMYRSLQECELLFTHLLPRRLHHASEVWDVKGVEVQIPLAGILPCR